MLVIWTTPRLTHCFFAQKASPCVIQCTEESGTLHKIIIGILWLPLIYLLVYSEKINKLHIIHIQVNILIWENYIKSIKNKNHYIFNFKIVFLQIKYSQYCILYYIIILLFKLIYCKWNAIHHHPSVFNCLLCRDRSSVCLCFVSETIVK